MLDRFLHLVVLSSYRYFHAIIPELFENLHSFVETLFVVESGIQLIASLKPGIAEIARSGDEGSRSIPFVVGIPMFMKQVELRMVRFECLSDLQRAVRDFSDEDLDRIPRRLIVEHVGLIECRLELLYER